MTATIYSHLHSVMIYALLLSWGLSTMRGLARREGIVVANSGVFLVLFIVLGIGGLKNEVQTGLDTVAKARLKIERQQSQLEAAVATSSATRAGLVAQTVLIEVLEIRLSEFSSTVEENEINLQKVANMREQIVEAKANVLELEKSAAEMKASVSLLEADLKEQQSGFELAGNEAVAIADNINFFETLMVILGTLQMTFGTYLVRGIRKGA